MRHAKQWSIAVLTAICAYALTMGVWSTTVKWLELSNPNVTYETSGWRQVERFEPSNAVAYLLMGTAFIALFILSWRTPRGLRSGLPPASPGPVPEGSQNLAPGRPAPRTETEVEQRPDRKSSGNPRRTRRILVSVVLIALGTILSGSTYLWGWTMMFAGSRKLDKVYDSWFFTGASLALFGVLILATGLPTSPEVRVPDRTYNVLMGASRWPGFRPACETGLVQRAGNILLLASFGLIPVAFWMLGHSGLAAMIFACVLAPVGLAICCIADWIGRKPFHWGRLTYTVALLLFVGVLGPVVAAGGG